MKTLQITMDVSLPSVPSALQAIFPGIPTKLTKTIASIPLTDTQAAELEALEAMTGSVLSGTVAFNVVQDAPTPVAEAQASDAPPVAEAA